MSPWLLLTVATLAVALGAAAPSSAFELSFGGRRAAPSRQGSSHSTFSFGADLALLAASGLGARRGGNLSSPARTPLGAAAAPDTRIGAPARRMTIRRIGEGDGRETRLAPRGALHADGVGTEALHAAINANPALLGWRHRGGIETENVLAAGQTADGSLAVFTSGS